jgi:hypothetical protein
MNEILKRLLISSRRYRVFGDARTSGSKGQTARLQRAADVVDFNRPRE